MDVDKQLQRPTIYRLQFRQRRLTLYEEKYGILSADFHDALMGGKLTKYDAFDETRTDFSRWKGIYETWMRRKEAYTKEIQKRDLPDALRIQPAY